MNPIQNSLFEQTGIFLVQCWSAFPATGTATNAAGSGCFLFLKCHIVRQGREIFRQPVVIMVRKVAGLEKQTLSSKMTGLWFWIGQLIACL
jgi:hypothetical protein